MYTHNNKQSRIFTNEKYADVRTSKKENYKSKFIYKRYCEIYYFIYNLQCFSDSYSQKQVVKQIQKKENAARKKKTEQEEESRDATSCSFAAPSNYSYLAKLRGTVKRSLLKPLSLTGNPTGKEKSKRRLERERRDQRREHESEGTAWKIEVMYIHKTKDFRSHRTRRQL